MPIIAVALLAIMGLPESIKYMALHESQRGKMEALINVIRPNYKVPPDARFVVEDEQQSPSSSPIHLFGNGLALITPLTWLMFAFNLMGYFFLISWTPTLMTAKRMRHRRSRPCPARRCRSMRHRRCARAVLVAAAPSLRRGDHLVRRRGAGRRLDSSWRAGRISTLTTALLTATSSAGAIVLGIQSGINVCGALIYPTSLRANGSGWQLGIGRIGAIIGPFLGALFVGLPVEQLLQLVGPALRRRRRGGLASSMCSIADATRLRGAAGIGQGAIDAIRYLERLV